MGDLLGTLSLGDVGAASLVVLGILLIFTGRLVPIRWHREIREDRDRWHTAYEQLRATQVVTEQQVGQLVASSATTLEVLRTIQTVVSRERT
ncbi:MAG: hypothetical protein ACRD0W_00500 [Acidimicrobiales bacterium]